MNKTGFVQRELLRAIELLEAFPPGDVFIIPVRLDDSHPRHQRLLELHWIDLFPAYEEGLNKLLRSLGLHSAAVEISEYDSYGLLSTRNTSDGKLTVPLQRDEDGFITSESVADMVLGRIQGTQHLRAQPILLFENTYQRTWLVITESIVACVLDDTKKLADYNALRWHCRHRFARPVETSSYKRHIGLLHFGSEHRDWLYSLHLHPDETLLKREIEQLLR